MFGRENMSCLSTKWHASLRASLRHSSPGKHYSSRLFNNRSMITISDPRVLWPRKGGDGRRRSNTCVQSKTSQHKQGSTNMNAASTDNCTTASPRALDPESSNQWPQSVRLRVDQLQALIEEYTRDVRVLCGNAEADRQEAFLLNWLLDIMRAILAWSAT